MKIKIIIGVIILLVTNIVIAQNLGESSVYVNGNCDMCKSTIENAAMSSPGVVHANWDSNSKSLNLVYNKDQFSMDSTLISVGNAGYDNEDYVAHDDAYNKLAPCCQYRETSKVSLDMYHKANNNKDKLNAFIRGVVYDYGTGGNKQSLPGVHVYYLGTEMGVMTDENGLFSLPLREEDIDHNEPGHEHEASIIVSYLGYQNDTLKVANNAWVEVTLTEGVLMNEVVIRHRKKATEYSFINPLKVESINQGELEKAACCNLSESFTTNASVDDTATDAVTGTRQIQLLGLASPYVQITLEKVPYIRGLSAVSGFNLVPGPWISSMQLNTGTGSVSDGYEAMTGQINVQYKEPDSKERLFVNLYGNKSGATEANIVGRILKTENVKSSLLVHTQYRPVENDHNDDGFLDMPLTKHLFVSNKTKFVFTDTWKGRIMINGSVRDETGGQNSTELSNPWKLVLNEKKLDGYIKTGNVFKSKKKTSIGFIGSSSYHQQSTQFGNKQYDATHKNLYSNLTYESIIGSKSHAYRVGISFQSDQMEEDITINSEKKNYIRDEKVIGAYGEYTYKLEDKFTAVIGLRGDIHNKHGFFFTPRLHLRYMPMDELVFRASVGRGRRTASIFAENPGIFVSSREIIVEGGTESNGPYGLKREDSWTFGGNISYSWTIFGKETLLSSDYYLTNFVDQVIIDWDSPRSVRFYNLDGKSFSKSFKTQWDIELMKGLDMRLAYRYNDVQSDYKTLDGKIERREKPLNSAHRFFVNIGYKTEKDWKFDVTFNRQGSKRLPDTSLNPVGYQLTERSPEYYTLSGQVSKTWGKWEVYLGGENLTNFKQSNPILSADNPWSPQFDASMIWGPVFGSNFYLGMRYNLED